METFIINDEIWAYVTEGPTAQAVIAPSGKAYLLPHGASITDFSDEKGDRLSISHKFKNGKGQTKLRCKAFGDEAAFQEAVNYLFADEVSLMRFRLAFRNPKKTLGIVFDDVAIPISRYRKPFFDLDSVKSYLIDVCPSRTLPQWVSKRQS